MNNKVRFVILVLFVSLVLVLVVLINSPAFGSHQSALAGPDTQTTVQTSPSTAEHQLVLKDGQGEYQLGLFLSLLEDPSGNLTIEDVTSPVLEPQFIPSQVEVPNYIYTDSAYWVRMDLDNQTSYSNEWLLEIGFANTHYVDLYTPSLEGEGYVVKQTGALMPVSTRDVLYPKIVFSLNVPTHSQQVIYLRFKSGASMTIPLTLWTKDAFIARSGQELTLHWLLFGGFIALLIYHLFLLSTLKEINYLSFIAMLTGMLAVLLEYTGYMGVYILPDLYNYKVYFLPFFVAFMYLSILVFSDAFLELRARLPKLHWLTVAFVAGWGLLLMLIPFLNYLNMARLMSPMQLVTIAAIFVIGIVAWNQDFRPVRYFMIAWLGMAASLFLLVLVRLGIAPSTAFNENVFQLGFFVMAVSWSFALADRINILKAASERTAKELLNSEHRLSQILEGLPLGVVVYGKDQKPTFLNRRTSEILANPTQGIGPDVSAGRTIGQAIEYFSFQVAGTNKKYPLENMPVYQALQGIPSSVDDIAVKRMDGQSLLEVWASPIKDAEGNVESAVAIIQDITARKKAEIELDEYRKQLESLVKLRTAEIDQVNQDLELRLEWLSLINSIHQNITGSSSIPTVYTDLLEKALHLLKSDLVFILRWNDQTDDMEVISNLANDAVALEADILRKSFKKGSALRSEIESFALKEWSSDHSDSLPAPIKSWFLEHNIRQAMFAPIFIGQSVIGVLGTAASSTDRNFSLKQSDFLERIALDLSSLAQDASLLDKTLALVAMDERNRLARDLHDSVTQVLFTATLLTEVLPQIWQKNPEHGLQTLEKLKKLTRGALAEMRTMLIELRPSAVLNTPLSELLAQLTEALTSRSNVSFRLFIEQIPILPEVVQMNFYRIAQEALNNVVKHSQALYVEVSLSDTKLFNDGRKLLGHQVNLVIHDDGVGFYPANIKPNHLGIGIMRERAAAIQADLTLQSEPGHGTLLSVIWSSEIKLEEQYG